MDLHCLHDLAWFLCLQKMKRLTVSDCELALSPSLPVHPHSTHLTLIITSWADWATVPFWAWGSSWSSHNYVHREGNGLYPFNVLPVLSFSFPPPPPHPPKKDKRKKKDYYSTACTTRLPSYGQKKTGSSFGDIPEQKQKQNVMISSGPPTPPNLSPTTTTIYTLQKYWRTVASV